MPCLRVVSVRDGGGPDFEVAFRLCELFGERGFWAAASNTLFSASRISKYACATRRIRSWLPAETSLPPGKPGFSLFVSNPVLIAKQRLCRGHGQRIGVILGVASDQTGCRRTKGDIAVVVLCVAGDVSAGSNPDRPCGIFSWPACSLHAPRHRRRRRIALPDIPTTNRPPLPRASHRIRRGQEQVNASGALAYLNSAPWRARPVRPTRRCHRSGCRDA